MSEHSTLLAEFQLTLTRHLKPNCSLLLALSGGLDSIVLLHLLNQVKQSTPFNLHAMHVHHGLSKNADDWADFCAQQCDLLGVPLTIAHVKVSKNSKAGIEATARKLRYEALYGYQLNGCQPDLILTAHHQNDQAETLLLQLFRGAGVKGLASMAEYDETKRLLRPFLSISRAQLLDYATTHQLKWCEDESNQNVDFARNYIRHEVMPLLQTRYSAIQFVLARTASHFAEANHLLDTLAEIDGIPLLSSESLCLTGLANLDQTRAKNVLRWWLAKHQISLPNSLHLSEMLHQLLHAKQDANIHFQLGQHSLKRYQQRAYLVPQQQHMILDLLWNGEDELLLPYGGKLLFKQVLGAGIALKHGIKSLKIKQRNGGEYFKPDVNRPTRTLKHLLQEANIPPWQRDQVPLVYWQDTLVYVPKIGVAAGYMAKADEFGLEVIWRY